MSAATGRAAVTGHAVTGQAAVAEPLDGESGAAAALLVDRATVTIDGHAIVREASLALNPGEVSAIVGPNGAGKSTLLSVAAGTCVPSSGRVMLGGDDLRSLSPRERARRRAVMPQATTVAFPFTVREVVAMGRVAVPEELSTGRGHSDDALRLAGIEHLADRVITTLSGGEHQRVAFARVIAQALPIAPGSVILLDEPTAAMDIAHAEVSLCLARRLAADGAAVAMVLHDLDAAACYADRLVVMSAGRIVASGNVADVCRPELLSRVYGTEIEVLDHDGRRRVLPGRAR